MLVVAPVYLVNALMTICDDLGQVQQLRMKAKRKFDKSTSFSYQPLRIKAETYKHERERQSATH